MALTLLLTTLLLLLSTTLLLTSYRLHTILSPTRRKPLRHGRHNPHEPTHLLIILGSGGHTAEMLSMLTNAITPTSTTPTPTVLNWRDFTHRTYLISTGDNISKTRAEDFEQYASSLGQQAGRGRDNGNGTYDVVEVRRAREIHQSLFSAPVSCARCAWDCWGVLGRYVSGTRDGYAGVGGVRDFPDLILCNGPATGAVVVGVSVVMRFVDWRGVETRGKMRSVYVESWARVKRLSLTGRLLRWVVDRFIVQWPQLVKGLEGKAEYIGVLV